MVATAAQETYARRACRPQARNDRFGRDMAFNMFYERSHQFGMRRNWPSSTRLIGASFLNGLMTARLSRSGVKIDFATAVISEAVTSRNLVLISSAVNSLP